MTEPLSPDGVDYLLGDDGDLFVPANGRVPLSSGIQAIAQGAQIRFGVWRGEWFADVQQGIPYLQNVFVTGVSNLSLTPVFRRALLAMPGVTSVESLELARPQPRNLQVIFVAGTNHGVLDSTSFAPFIVTV